MRTFVTTCLLSAVLLVSACGDKEGAAKASSNAAAPPAAGAAVAFNAKCPVSGDAVDAKIAAASFKNQQIGFCCAKCPPKFKAMTDVEKVAALAKNGAKLPQ